ncbi:MAG: response regulator [Clostridia bacterium]|nr:response regulator [Clostridia bacterium]
MKILIVDDQASVHKFMDNAIEWKSIRVTEVAHAYNGSEALDMIRRTHPDLVLLDIKMPQMDGLQLIQELANLHIKQKVVILSAYNEFEYARQALRFGVKDYLLKPIDSKKLGSVISSMANEIENEKGAIIEEALSAMVYSYKCSDNTCNDFKRILEDTNARQFFCMFFLNRNPALENIMEDFSQYLKKSLLKDCPGLQINKEEYLMIGLVCGEETYKTECTVLLEVLRAFKKECGSIDLIAGVSNASENMEDIKELYLKAKEALNLAFYSSEDVYYYSNALLANRIDNTALDTLTREVLDCIRMNYYEFKCIDSIKNYFDYFRKYKVSKNMVLLACNSLIATINEKLRQEYHGKNILLDEITQQHIFPWADINILEMEFSRRFFAILGRIRSLRSKSDIDIVKEIKSYIDVNYHENLSLDNIAERFYISKYQLSRVFKKEIGINYWDYVTRVRMEKASLLIKNSDNKIYEVAEKVGYEDISYFSTNFKKYFGKSPKEYKAVIANYAKESEVPLF